MGTHAKILMGRQASSQTRRGGRTTAGGRRLAAAQHQATDPSVRLTLSARADQISVVRSVLDALVESLELPAGLAVDMRLAVTEACTNVVRHAYDEDEDGSLELIARVAPGTIEVEVRDKGRGIGASGDSEGPGLGLPLIAALTDRLDVRHAPGGGSRLTMTFSLEPPDLAAVERG